MSAKAILKNMLNGQPLQLTASGSLREMSDDYYR
jgi:hypothetical protein